MRLLAVSLVLTVSMATVFAGDVAPTLGQLMKQRLDEQVAEGNIRNEQNQLLAAMNGKVSGYWQQINVLQGPAKNDEQITQMKAQLEMQRANLEAQEKALEMAQIKDPEQRKAKIKVLEEERNKAAQELTTAQAPFNKRIQDLVNPLVKNQDDYSALLSKFIKDAPGLKADKMNVNGGQWANLIWKDADGKNAVYGSINAVDPKTQFATPNKMDGKYPISLNTPNQLDFYAGFFRVSIRTEKKELQGDTTKMTDLVKSLLDVDGLAALKAE